MIGKRKTTAEFVNEARQIHGQRYDYEQVSYQRHNKNVVITCAIHGDFQQTPHNHLHGRGCPKCSGHGFTNRERFEQYVQKRNDGCWEWTAGRNHLGYGKFSIKGKHVAAHRFAYQLYKGIEPGDLVVCHSCDNPWCVNPDHLSLGSQKANIHDMMSKQRMPKAENHANSKLTDKQVKAIRDGFPSLVVLLGGKMKAYRQLAELHHVSWETVRALVNNRYRSH